VLLTGPFGGLTDDVREFLRRLDGDAPALLAAGVAMSGPEPPPTLADAAAN
jgi:hypothetical protein